MGTEFLRWYKSEEGDRSKRDMFCGLSMNSAIVSSLYAYLYFLNGMTFTVLLATAAHSLVGRLRPHFLDVCRPDWDEIDCNFEDCSQKAVYVTNYTCRGDVERFGEDAAEALVEDARKSFFSGHASTAFASMTFVILFLQARAASKSTNGVLLVPFLQLFAFGLAFVTAISRVTDFAHHPSDVIAGAIVGTSVQILNVLYIQRLFSEDDISVGDRATTTKKCDETPVGDENIPMLESKDGNAC